MLTVRRVIRFPAILDSTDHRLTARILGVLREAATYALGSLVGRTAQLLTEHRARRLVAVAATRGDIRLVHTSIRSKALE